MAKKASPILKWAGGKRQLIEVLLKHTPKQFERYYEPFVGGGALFFSLAPQKACLGDSNLRLIRTYRAIQHSVEEVIERLSLLSTRYHAGDQDAAQAMFYEARSQTPDEGSDVDMAVWLIFMNKTCYNGLYRVNRKNVFNVPFGRYKRPSICDEEKLRAVSQALQGVDLVVGDFAAAVAKSGPGDFVYFDPPYVPLTETSGFTSYSVNGFGHAEQVRLRDLALDLKSRGARVLLSNSWTSTVVDLYRHFEVEKVVARRAIGADANTRKVVYEALIY